MDTLRLVALAGCVAADTVEDGPVRTGPPELFVMMDGAEDRMGWESEHEIAAAKVFQKSLNEILQMRCLVGPKLDRRGVAATGEHLGVDAGASDELGKPGLAAKIQLKSPVTQRHDPGDAGEVALPCCHRPARHV